MISTELHKKILKKAETEKQKLAYLRATLSDYCTEAKVAKLLVQRITVFLLPIPNFGTILKSGMPDLNHTKKIKLITLLGFTLALDNLFEI